MEYEKTWKGRVWWKGWVRSREKEVMQVAGGADGWSSGEMCGNTECETPRPNKRIDQYHLVVQPWANITTTIT